MPLPVKVFRSELAYAREVRRLGGHVGFENPFPERLFKYVDARHASAVADGSLKLGTLRAYEELENGRSDDWEGTSVVHPTAVSLAKGENNATRAGLAEMGLESFGAVEIHTQSGAASFRAVSPNYISYCLSNVPDSQTLLAHGNQVVFEIVDVEAFVFRLLEKLEIPHLLAGQVTYSPRVFEAFDQQGCKRADPFRKDPVRQKDGYKFWDEQEYRLTIDPNDDIRTSTPYSVPS